jgi:crossover junction endodeoxyribonuclease RuvC
LRGEAARGPRKRSAQRAAGERGPGKRSAQRAAGERGPGKRSAQRAAGERSSGTVRILGIDPGSTRTGYGVVERTGSVLSRVEAGVIRPRAVSLAERLSAIHNELCRLIRRHQPDGVALEAVFTARNARSALVLGQARGAALAACGDAGLPTAEYAPSQVKSAVTGYGRADKAQVQQMVQRLLGLSERPQSDAADAMAVAICHAQGLRLRQGAFESAP